MCRHVPESVTCDLLALESLESKHSGSWLPECACDTGFRIGRESLGSKKTTAQIEQRVGGRSAGRVSDAAHALNGALRQKPEVSVLNAGALAEYF